jgi:hypothetical protein
VFRRVESKNISRLGALLLKKGNIDQSQLKLALDYQKKHQLLLGQSLVALELIDNQELQQLLHRQKWLRSIVASFVLASVPVCPVLASERKIDFEPNHTTLAHNSHNSHNQSNSTDKNSSYPSEAIVKPLEAIPKAADHFSQPFYQGQLANHNYAIALEADLNANKVIGDDSNDGFLLGINHSFSRKSGVKFGISNPTLEHQMAGIPAETTYVAQIAFYTSTQSRQPSNKGSKLNSFGQYSTQIKPKVKRFDRYKNTLPAMYSLTLKGYSLLETSANQIQTLSLQRHKDSPYRKYEVMFSVTKRF